VVIKNNNPSGCAFRYICVEWPNCHLGVFMDWLFVDQFSHIWHQHGECGHPGLDSEHVGLVAKSI